MEKTGIAIISFVFGAVAGSIATYFVMKQQMEPELEVVYEPNDEIKERIKEDSEKKVDTERKVVTESTKQEDEQDKKEYENIIRKYNHQLKKPEVDIREMLNKKPYLILHPPPKNNIYLYRFEPPNKMIILIFDFQTWRNRLYMLHYISL